MTLTVTQGFTVCPSQQCGGAGVGFHTNTGRSFGMRRGRTGVYLNSVVVLELGSIQTQAGALG